MPAYRAAGREAVLVVPLDSLTLAYHRASGITHVLVEPAPEILAALVGEALSRDALVRRLSDVFDMEGDTALLDERLAELVEAGLVVVVEA